MQKGFSSILILIIAFIMIALLGIGIWYYFQYQTLQNEGTQTQAPILIPPTTSPQAQSIVPDTWLKYSSTSTGFTFFFPPEADIREETGDTVVFLLGPTQNQGTELYDGLSITLATSPLNGKTLRQVADESQEETAADPAIHTISQVEQTSFGGKSGYKFSVASLGERDVIFLPFEGDLYLEVINSTVDPTNAGFQDMAELIVSSVQSS